MLPVLFASTIACKWRFNIRSCANDRCRYQDQLVCTSRSNKFISRYCMLSRPGDRFTKDRKS